MSAYSKHANVLLSDDPEIDVFLQRALAATLDDSLTADDLVALTLKPETMVSEAWRCSILQIPVPMAILKLPE